MGKHKAYVWVDAQSGLVKIRSPYKQFFVSELKARIPSDGRRWNPADKLWEVEPEYMDDLLRVASIYYAVEEHEKAAPVFVKESGNGDPYAAMLKLAKLPTIEKIYKLIARDVHPDLGGDDQAMSVLNEAYRKIQETWK